MKRFQRILSTLLALILLLGTYTPAAYAEGTSGLDALAGLSFDTAALSETPRLDLSNLDKALKKTGSLSDLTTSGQEKEFVSKASKLMEDGLKKLKDFQDAGSSEDPGNGRPAPSPGEKKENDVKNDLQALGLDLSFLKDLDVKKLDDWKIPDLKSLDPFAEKDGEKAGKNGESSEKAEKKDETKKNAEKENLTGPKKDAQSKEAKEALDQGAKEFAEPVLKDGQAGKVYTLTLDGKNLQTQMEYELSRDDEGKPSSITWVYKIYTKEQKPDLYNTFITYPDDGLDSPFLLTEESTKEEKAFQKVLTEAREAFSNSELNQTYLSDYEKSLLLTYDLEHLLPSEQGYYYSKVVTPIHSEKDENDNGGWTLDVQTRLGSVSAIQRFRINKDGNLLWPKDGADPKDFAPQMTSKFTKLSRRATVAYANTGNKEITYAPQLDLLSPEKLSQARIEVYDLVRVDDALTQEIGDLGKMDLSKLGFDQKDLDRLDLSRLDSSAWNGSLKDWTVKDLTRVGIIKDARDLDSYMQVTDPGKDIKDAQKALEDLLGPAKIKGADLLNKTADLLLHDNINGYAFRPVAQGKVGEIDPKKPLKLAPGQLAVVSLVELNKEGLDEKNQDLKEKAAGEAKEKKEAAEKAAAEAKKKAEAEAKEKKEAAEKAAAEAKKKAEAEAKEKKEAAEKAAAEAKAKAEETAKAEKEKGEKAAEEAKAKAEAEAKEKKEAAEKAAAEAKAKAEETAKAEKEKGEKAAEEAKAKAEAEAKEKKEAAEKAAAEAKAKAEEIAKAAADTLNGKKSEKGKNSEEAEEPSTPKIETKKVTADDVKEMIKSAAQAQPLPKTEDVKAILENGLIQAGTALGIKQGTDQRDKLDQLMKEKFQDLARQYAPPLKAGGTTTLYISLTDKDTGAPLEGAVFSLFQSSGTNEELITNNKGQAIRAQLAAGSYYVQQLSAPAGYKPLTSIKLVTIKEGDSEFHLAYQNVKVSSGTSGGTGDCALTVSVVEKKNEEVKIPGAIIEITRQDGAMEPLTLTTDGEGKVYAQLSSGDYTVRQLSSDKDHLPWLLPKPLTILDTQTTSELTFVNVKRSDAIHIFESGGGGPVPLKLLVYDKADHTKRIANADFRIVGEGEDITVSTGSDGIAEIKGLKYGTYTITQLSAPEDYVPYPSSITITKSFFNDPYIIKIENAYSPQGQHGVAVYVKDITKDGSGVSADRPVKNATVQILDDQEQIVSTQTTGEEGVIYFKGLDPDMSKYSFKLIQAPAEYGKPQNYQVSDLSGADLAPGKTPWRIFELEKASIVPVEITVFEKGDDKVKLAGAEFSLISLSDGTAQPLGPSDDNGKIRVNVPEGDYKLVQTKSADGYVPMPGEYGFTASKIEDGVTGDNIVLIPNALTDPTKKMVTLTVDKVWQKQPQPSVTATVRVIDINTGKTALDKDGKEAKAEISSINQTNLVSFTLRKYDDQNKLIPYHVVEDPLDGFYSSCFQNGLTFSLTNYPEATGLESNGTVIGRKNWQNDSEKDRPSSVTVELLKDDKPYQPAKTKTVGKAEAWTYEFDNLPSIDPDTHRPIVYTVREVNPPAGYNTVASPVGYDLINIKEGAPTGSFTLKKTDSKGEPLPGASFQLRRIKAHWDSSVQPDGAWAADDPKEVEYSKTLDVTDPKGTLLFDDLQDGLYELEEIKAPVKEETDASGKVIVTPYKRDDKIHQVQVYHGFITIDEVSYHSKADKGSFPSPYTEEINQEKARNPQPFKREIPEGYLSKRISALEDDQSNKYQMELTVEGKSEFSEGKAVDVVLVVDHSGSVRKNNHHETVRQQVNTLVQKLVGQPNIRLGYVEYSGFSLNYGANNPIGPGTFGGYYTPPDPHITMPQEISSPFRKFPIKSGTSSILSSIPLSRPADITNHTDYWHGSGFNTDHFSNATFTQEGLLEAKRILDAGRADAEKKIILITDGGPTLSFMAKSKAQKIPGMKIPNPGMGYHCSNTDLYNTYATDFYDGTGGGEMIVVGDGIFYRFMDGFNKDGDKSLAYNEYYVLQTGSGREKIVDNAYATMSYVYKLNQEGYEISTLAYDLANPENYGWFDGLERKILPNLASPGRYKESQNAADLAEDFEDLFHLNENYATKSIQQGIVEDPMGEHIELDLGSNGIFNANDYFLTASKPSLLEGVEVTYDQSAKKIRLTGLNLKSGEWVRLNYKVSLDETAEKDTFYRTNGPTTLQPKGNEPGIKRDFPVPAIRKYEALFPVTNNSPYPFILNKVDAEKDPNGQTIFLPHAEFILKKENAEGNYEPITEPGAIVSGDGGVIELNNLSLGNYCLEETKAPEGYELPEETCFRFKVVQNEWNEFVLVTEKNTTEIENYRKYPKGEFELRKLDAADQYLPGATFTLYKLEKDDQGQVTEVEITKQVTNGTKNLVFKDLKPGQYRLRETEAPGKYTQINGYWDITVDAQGFTQVVGHLPQTYQRQRAASKAAPVKPMAKSFQGPAESLAFARKAVPASPQIPGSGTLAPAALKASSGRLQMSPPAKGPALRSVVNEETTVNNESYDMISKAIVVSAEGKEYRVSCRITPKLDSNISRSDFYFAVETSDYADGPNDQNVFTPMLKDFIQKLKDYNQDGRLAVLQYRRADDGSTDQNVSFSEIADYQWKNIINVIENTPKTRTVRALRNGLNNNNNADDNNRKMGIILSTINGEVQKTGSNQPYVVICSPYDAQKSGSLYPVSKAIRDKNGQIYAYTGIFKGRIDNGKFYQNANNAVVNDPGNIIYYSYDDQGNYLMGTQDYRTDFQNKINFGLEKPTGIPQAKDLLEKIFTPDKLVSAVTDEPLEVIVPEAFTVLKAEGCDIIQNPDGTTTIRKTNFTADKNKGTEFSYEVKLTRPPQSADDALPVWKSFSLKGKRKNDRPIGEADAPTVKDDGLTITIDSKLIQLLGGNETLTENTEIPLKNVCLKRALLKGQPELARGPFDLSANTTKTFTGLEAEGLDEDSVRRPYTYTVTADVPKDYVLSYRAADIGGAAQQSGELEGSGTLTICLRQVGTSFTVRKIWQSNQTLPKGLTVHLLRRIKGSEEDPIDTGRTLLLTAEDGWQGAFTDLEAVDSQNQPYEYFVREETPEMNDGYYRVSYTYDPDGRGVTIRSEAVPVITVHNYEPSITFLKKDGLSQPLTGGTFILKKVEGGTETVVKTKQADQGRLVFDHLEPGTKDPATGEESPAVYKIYETKAPEGFEAPGEGAGKEVASFKIKANGTIYDITPTSGTILNKHQPVHVYLRKVDKEDSAKPPIPLSGAEFDLYLQKILPLAENMTPNNENVLDIGDMADSNNSNALLKYAGKYNIRDKRGTLVQTFATKKDASGTVSISGKDGLSADVTVIGRHISINNMDPAMGPYRLEVETDVKINGTFSSGADGKIDLGELAPGTYRLFETKPPEGGYRIPPAPVVILVKPDGNVQVAGIDVPATDDQPADIINSKKKTGMLGALKVSRGSSDSVDAVSGATYAVWTTTVDLTSTDQNIKSVEWKIIDDPHRYVPFEKNNDPNTPESHFYKRYGFLIDMVDQDAAGNTVYYRIEEGRAPMGYSGSAKGSYVVKMMDPGGDSTKLEVEWIRVYDENGKFVKLLYNGRDRADSDFRNNHKYLYYDNDGNIQIPKGGFLGLALDLDADTSDPNVELLPSLLVDNQPNQLKLIKYDTDKAQEPGQLPADSRLAGAKFAIYYRDDLVGTEFPYVTLDANGNPVKEKVRLSPLVKNPDVEGAYLAPEYGRDMTNMVPDGMTLEEVQYTAISDANGIVTFKKLPQRFIKYKTVDFKKDWPNTVPDPNVRPHYYLVELEAPEGYERKAEAMGPFLATETGFISLESPLTDTAVAKDGKSIKAPQKFTEGSDSYYAYQLANMKYTVRFRKVFRDYRQSFGTYPMNNILFALYRKDVDDQKDGIFKPVKFTATEPAKAIYSPADTELTEENASQFALTGTSSNAGELSFVIPLDGTYAIKEINTPDYYLKTDFAWKFTVDKEGKVRAMPEGYVPMEGDFDLKTDPNNPQNGPNIAGGISSVDYSTGRFTSYFYVNPNKRFLDDARMYIYVPEEVKSQYTVDIFKLPDGAANANGTFPKIPNQTLVSANISDQIERDTVNNYISILFYRSGVLFYENLMDETGYVVRVTGPFDAQTDGQVGIEAQLEAYNSHIYDRDVARIQDYQPLTGRRIDGTGSVNEIINNSIIRFTKVSAPSGTDPGGLPLAGAVFTLSRQETDPITQEHSWVLVTDYPGHPDGEFETTGSGSLNLERLPEGKYKLEEIKVPAGFNPNSKVIRTFSVSPYGRFSVDQPQAPGERFEILKNLPLGKETLKVQKFKADGESPLPKAKFKLITPYGESGAKEVDANGELSFGELLPGTYYLKEVEAPPGYILDPQAHRVLVKTKDGDYKAPRDQRDHIDKKNNVGPLLEITGMEAKTSGGRTDIIYPNQAQSLLATVNIKIRQPKEIKPGDYCVIKLSDTVDTHGIGDSKDDNFDIYAAGGRVAEGFYDREKNTITYVFTDYLKDYQLLSMEPSIQLYPDRVAFPQNGTMSYSLTLTDDLAQANYSEAKRQIQVDYRDQYGSYYRYLNGMSLGSFITQCHRNLNEDGEVVEPGNPGSFTWIGYINPAGNRFNNAELIFKTSTHYDYENMKVALYPVPDSLDLPVSYGIKTEDLEREIPLPKGEQGISVYSNQLRINLGDRLKEGKRYVVKITGKLGAENLKKPLETTGELVNYYYDSYGRTYARSVTSNNFSRFYVNSSESDISILFSLTNNPNHVELTKIGSDGHPIIEDGNLPEEERAKFKLQKQQDDKSWLDYLVGDPPAETIGLNSEGKIVYRSLPPGNYRVFETKAPKDYFDPGTSKPVASFTIGKNGALIDLDPASGQIVNKPRKLTFEKYLVYPSGVPKAAGKDQQAVFSLYQYDKTKGIVDNPFLKQGTAFKKEFYNRVPNPGTENETGIKKGAYLTDQDGKVTLTGLKNGAYYGLVEDQAPPGFSLLDTGIIRIFHVAEDGRIEIYRKLTLAEVPAGTKWEDLAPKLLDSTVSEGYIHDYKRIMNRHPGFPQTGGLGPAQWLALAGGTLLALSAAAFVAGEIKKRRASSLKGGGR